MSIYRNILNSIETDFAEMGDAKEYENPEDRFIIWAIVDFDIGGENYYESVVFDCGQVGDNATWENYKWDHFTEDQTKFLDKCLSKAEGALIKLKKRLQEDQGNV